jgi:hypothetical protein
MKKLILERQAGVAAFALTLPMSSIAWLVAVPGLMSPVTFTAVSFIALGAAYVGLNTWRNSLATEHIGHVLNRTEGAGARPATVNDLRSEP